MWPLHQRNQTKSTGQVNSINAVSLHSKNMSPSLLQIECWERSGHCTLAGTVALQTMSHAQASADEQSSAPTVHGWSALAPFCSFCCSFKRKAVVKYDRTCKRTIAKYILLQHEWNQRWYAGTANMQSENEEWVLCEEKEWLVSWRSNASWIRVLLKSHRMMQPLSQKAGKVAWRFTWTKIRYSDTDTFYRSFKSFESMSMSSLLDTVVGTYSSTNRFDLTKSVWHIELPIPNPEA